MLSTQLLVAGLLIVLALNVKQSFSTPHRTPRFHSFGKSFWSSLTSCNELAQYSTGIDFNSFEFLATLSDSSPPDEKLSEFRSKCNCCIFNWYRLQTVFHAKVRLYRLHRVLREISIIVFGNLVLWPLLYNESPNFSKEVDCYGVVFRWFVMSLLAFRVMGSSLNLRRTGSSLLVRSGPDEYKI